MEEYDGVAPEDELVVSRLREMLKEVDLDTCTERQLRERLEKEFQLSLKDKKDLVRKEIEDFLLIKSAEDELQTAATKSKKRGKSRRLSPQMQAFMGTEMASWQEVTSAVWKYVRNNQLQQTEDRRNINLDGTLRKIFKEPLSMFNLSEQMGKHVLEDSYDDIDRSPKKLPKMPKSKAKSKGKGKGTGKKTGFMRPLRLTGELREMLGLKNNENINRGELSKRFWDYFRRYDLQDPSDRRWVLSDDTLKNLLGIERFQAFSIQKLCKHHILGYVDDTPEAATLTQEEIPEEAGDGETEATPNGNVDQPLATNEDNPQNQDNNNDDGDQPGPSNQDVMEPQQTPTIIPETQITPDSAEERNQELEQDQQDLQGEEQAQEASQEAIDQSLFPKEDGGEPVLESNQGVDDTEQDIYAELLQQIDDENVAGS